MSKLVVIDAGHGGSDPGAVNGSRYEKDDVLRLARQVESLLRAQGVKVQLTRTGDDYLSLAQRSGLANTAGADLFVSLHRNSYTNAAANGVEIWVHTTAGAVDVAAASEVLERIVAVGAQSNRGVKKGNYHVLRETAMPSMLVELGFISNAADNDLFDRHLEQYAAAVAQGICAALGTGWSEGVGGQAGGEDGGGLYRVQVGAFASESNARAFLETVRGMGLDAFLVLPDGVAAGE